MQIETCQVGGVIRLGENARLVIHRQERERVVLGATAPAGTSLIFDGAHISPMSGTAGASTFLFSLQAIRRFVLGRYEVQVWLPGELVSLAADCEDWLHIGITILPEPVLPFASNTAEPPCPLPAPVAAACPLHIKGDAGRPFVRSAP
jgi:hypothetical protein